MTFAVLGGGISGLASAFYLRHFGYSGRVILLESSERLGGWINSHITADNTRFELGPRTLRVAGNSGANTLHLAELLHLQDKVIPVPYQHPAVQNRLIKVNGKLHKLPNNLKSVFQKLPPFSKSLIAHILKDLRAPRVLSCDESLYSFVQRRFGTEVAMYAADPLCRGVFAGSARDISINAFAKRIYSVEQEYGSVIKGLLLDRKFKEVKDKSVICNLTKRAKREKWSVWSLEGGLQTLVSALENSIKNHDVEIIKNAEISQLTFEESEVVLTSKEKIFTADRIISCIPSCYLKTVVKDNCRDLYRLLDGIPFVSVTVVNLEYAENIISEPAFGYLVPSHEPSKVLGVIYDSETFPQNGKTVLTMMMGGYWFNEILGESPSEEQILDIAVEEIRATLKVLATPKSFKVSILKNCIPQYTVGHNEVVDNARKLIKDLKLPFGLAGNSYDGVGVNDAIYSAKKIVSDML